MSPEQPTAWPSFKTGAQLEADAAQTFAVDIVGLEMSVLLDEGLHRHLKFKAPGWGFHAFDIITWPGGLLFSGDMGTFAFARVEDMFEFFRSREQRINAYYWAEKVSGEPARRYSPDLLIEQVVEQVESTCGQLSPKAYQELVEQVTYDILDEADCEDAAYRALDHFDSEHLTFCSSDYMDSSQAYTHQFLWACHAIVHAIAAYDAGRPSEASIEGEQELGQSVVAAT